MQLHEEFGISVSDDTIYRALKDLGFSHLSARPKAYKQDPDAISIVDSAPQRGDARRAAPAKLALNIRHQIVDGGGSSPA
jgi:hypothetical protein